MEVWSHHLCTSQGLLTIAFLDSVNLIQERTNWLELSQISAYFFGFWGIKLWACTDYGLGYSTLEHPPCWVLSTHTFFGLLGWSHYTLGVFTSFQGFGEHGNITPLPLSAQSSLEHHLLSPAALPLPALGSAALHMSYLREILLFFYW